MYNFIKYLQIISIIGTIILVRLYYHYIELIFSFLAFINYESLKLKNDKSKDSGISIIISATLYFISSVLTSLYLNKKSSDNNSEEIERNYIHGENEDNEILLESRSASSNDGN